jgi:hypothetical protein
MSICARPCCLLIGTNRCSTCLREPYCSGDCQKAYWTAHKAIHKTLKKLSNQFQPCCGVVQVIVEILDAPEEKIGKNLRVLRHVESYAEFQLEDRVLGKSYRERENGEQISNWVVEIKFLYPIYSRFIRIYNNDKSLSLIMKNNMILPHL